MPPLTDIGLAGEAGPIRRRQRVAVVHNHWIHYKDLLFRAMAEAGIDFVVLFTAAGSTERLPAGVPELPYPAVALDPGPYEKVGHAGAAWRVWRALDRVRPAALIISGWCDCAAWSAWLWGRVHRVPMILWAGSNIFDRRRRAPLEATKRIFVRPFHAAHVYGRSGRAYLVRLGMEDRRIFTKRAVLDTELFRPVEPAAPKPPHKRLLFVGRLIREKNLETLLVALSRLRQAPEQPRLVLELVGYGPLDGRLRSLASHLAIEPFVRFSGAFEQRGLPAVYAAADGLVLPSVSETWGLVVNEAMCCGLPVLVSNRCGCAADLVSPETGWTFDPGDADGLARLLDEFASTPRERLAAMGEAARAIASGYSPRQCAAIVTKSIGAVLAANCGSPPVSCPVER